MKFLRSLRDWYQWWIATLLSILPESWRETLGRFSRDVEVVIAHQGATLFVQTDKGKIIETVANHSENTEQAAPGGRTAASSKQSVTQQQWQDTQSNVDEITNSEATAIDFDLTGTVSSPGHKDDSVDLLVDPGNDSVGDFRSDPGSNVIPLSLPAEDQITVVIDDGGDQTLRLQDHDATDITVNTLVINNDQGNLIHGSADPATTREETALFINDGGQIRQVSPDEMGSLPGEARLSEDITELVTDFDTQPESSEYSNVARLLAKYQDKNKCLYLLPDNKFFILNLSYPIEAVLSIETVLKYDLEKHIPLTFDEVRYFYALNVDSETERVKVEVAVIKASEYAELNAALAPYIGSRLVCSTHAFYRKYGTKINFLEDEHSGDWKSVTSLANIHTALNWVLLVVLLVFPIYHFQYRVDQVDSSAPEELVRVKELMASVREVNDGVKFGTQLVETVNRSTHTVELLDVLSSGINRKAWINRLTFKNGEVTIKGEAESATEVSDDLNRTGLFQSISFVSSIVKNSRSGKETFELQLVLKDSDA